MVAHNFMGLDKCTEMCIHYHHHDIEQFYYPKVGLRIAALRYIIFQKEYNYANEMSWQEHKSFPKLKMQYKYRALILLVSTDMTQLSLGPVVISSLLRVRDFIFLILMLRYYHHSVFRVVGSSIHQHTFANHKLGLCMKLSTLCL